MWFNASLSNKQYEIMFYRQRSQGYQLLVVSRMEFVVLIFLFNNVDIYLLYITYEKVS